MHLLARIEAHIRNTGISPSRLGREALGDPRFVHDVRRGRVPGPQTCRRVALYLGYGRELGS
jgi:hypothetical protein